MRNTKEYEEYFLRYILGESKTQSSKLSSKKTTKNLENLPKEKSTKLRKQTKVEKPRKNILNKLLNI